MVKCYWKKTHPMLLFLVRINEFPLKNVFKPGVKPLPLRLVGKQSNTSLIPWHAPLIHLGMRLIKQCMWIS